MCARFPRLFGGVYGHGSALYARNKFLLMQHRQWRFGHWLLITELSGVTMLPGKQQLKPPREE